MVLISMCYVKLADGTRVMSYNKILITSVCLIFLSCSPNSKVTRLSTIDYLRTASKILILFEITVIFTFAKISSIFLTVYKFLFSCSCSITIKSTWRGYAAIRWIYCYMFTCNINKCKWYVCKYICCIICI